MKLGGGGGEGGANKICKMGGWVTNNDRGGLLINGEGEA